MMRYFLPSLFLASAVAFPAPSASGEDRSFPCRIRDGANPDLFVMTLGNVETPLAQGRFYPIKDQIRLKDGTLLGNYYRDSLGVKFYRPLDKSAFPLPPSGWCSWYYYFYDINEDEIKRNAQWLAGNLKDFGLTYVQLDDGWEGIGRGFGENRDWTKINDRFPHGMDQLAAGIQQLGFKAGLWIAPHGQSNPKVIQAHPNAFLVKPDGTTLSDTWEGNYLVDPSTEEGQVYLRDLFRTLTRMGYDYFKIDGQPCVIEEYQRCAAQMKNPSTNPVALYRKTLETIHEAIGSQRYLLGCWERPLEGAGLTEGWRLGADVLPGWDGFLIALDATMGSYYLHNIVWYCDPDVVMVRHPLTLEQARVWATLQGLTGQALMASDRMMDLPSERVELYKRIFPAADIRPLDLFPSTTHKPIWDLKINHLDRNYDIVGLFNFADFGRKLISLNWKELGIAGGQSVHVYDFWHKEYLGVYPKGFSAELEPTSCKVLTLLPATSDIQLISTSRHLTQGWLDLLSLKFDPANAVFNGRSRVIKNDPYVLTFVFPPAKNFRISSAEAGGLPVKVASHQGWATVEFTPENTGEVNWTVHFSPEPWYHYPFNNPSGIKIELAGLDQMSVKWKQPGIGSIGSYSVSLDGEVIGSTRDLSFQLRDLPFGMTHSVSVTSVWEDGVPGTNKIQSLDFNLDELVRPAYSLTELEPVLSAARERNENIKVNQSLSDKPLVIGGTTFDSGLGVKTGSRIEFNLHGLFHEFTAVAGIDQTGKNSAVIFLVEGDGKELWNSGAVRPADGAQPVSVLVDGVKKLVLHVKNAGADKKGNSANWCNPVIRKKI